MDGDGREGGFVAAHHQLWSSPDLTGFKAQHLFVFITIVHLANWKPGHFWVGKHRVDVARGELANSLTSLAKEAKATIREVRTTIDNLLRRGVFDSRNVVIGDTVIRVLRVVNYDKFQAVGDPVDTGDDTPDAKAPTYHRHGGDMPPSLAEPREPREPREPEKQKPASSAADAASPPPPAGDQGPVVAVLPCVGSGPREYAVTETQVASWREPFPAVDPVAEVRKAKAWLEANPTKRKTHRGTPAFLVAWLGRSQDRAASSTGPPKPRLVTAAASERTEFTKGEVAL